MGDLVERLAAPPLFIVGTAQSGTNWVYEFLTRHPEVAGSRESWVFADEGPDLRLRSERVLEEAMEPPHRYVVEKSAAHVFHLRRIAELWPQARILHVMRDGREVALRVRRDAFRWPQRWVELFGDSLYSAGRAWARAVRSVQEVRRELGDRYLEVPFESLATEGRIATMHRILDFAGIAYTADFISDALSGEDGRLDRPVPEAWPTNYSVWRAWRFHRAAGDVLLSTVYEDDPKWWWRPVKRP